MIRIRKRDKSTITLPTDAMFVEMVDDYGQVLQVFCEDKAAHSFTHFGWPSEKSQKYAAVFKVDFVKQHHNLDLFNNKLLLEK